jgi:hypothetical protein
VIDVKRYVETRYGRRPEMLPVSLRRRLVVMVLGEFRGSDLNSLEALVMRMAVALVRLDNAWNALRAKAVAS